MRTTLSLLFFLRKPKNYQSGPIYLRITVDGQRTELAISRKYDAVTGRAIGSKADSKALNANQVHKSRHSAFIDDYLFGGIVFSGLF